MTHSTPPLPRASARAPMFSMVSMFTLLSTGMALNLAACTDAAAGDAQATWSGGDGLMTAAPDLDDETDSESGDEGGFDDDGEAPKLDLPAGDEGEESGCESELFSWDPILPQLVFVLDHSGSMTASLPSPLGGTWSRWEALHEVVRLTLERREDEVEFGLKIFPTPFLAESDGCAVTPGVEYPPTPNAMDDLLAVMPPADSSPVGATPIHAGIQAAGEALKAADASRPRAILLVADGGISASCGLSENSTDAASYLASLRQVDGIDSYVVAVGDTATDNESLETLAIAGGQGQVFESTDGAELDAAIGEIVDSLRSCELQLESPYPIPEEVALHVDDTEVEAVADCDSGEGYIYDVDTGRMTLCEQTCDAYLEGVNVEVEHFCQPG